MEKILVHNYYYHQRVTTKYIISVPRGYTDIVGPRTTESRVFYFFYFYNDLTN